MPPLSRLNARVPCMSRARQIWPPWCGSEQLAPPQSGCRRN
jgi:hypothetical protein